MRQKWSLLFCFVNFYLAYKVVSAGRNIHMGNIGTLFFSKAPLLGVESVSLWPFARPLSVHVQRIFPVHIFPTRYLLMGLVVGGQMLSMCISSYFRTARSTQSYGFEILPRPERMHSCDMHDAFQLCSFVRLGCICAPRLYLGVHVHYHFNVLLLCTFTCD